MIIKNYINGAIVILEKYFYLKNWYKINFNDKIYFSYITINKPKIIQKAGIYYCLK